MGGQHHAPTALLPGKETRYPLYRKLRGPGTGLVVCGNFVPNGFRSQTAQPTASRYTDWAILTPLIEKYTNKLTLGKNLNIYLKINRTKKTCPQMSGRISDRAFEHILTERSRFKFIKIDHISFKTKKLLFLTTHVWVILTYATHFLHHGEKSSSPHSPRA